MNIRVFAGVESADRVDHDFRLLAGGCIVEVHQALAPDRLSEHGEILANTLEIERSRCTEVEWVGGRVDYRRRHLFSRRCPADHAPRGHRPGSPAHSVASRSRTSRSSSARTGSNSTSSMTSAAKA